MPCPGTVRRSAKSSTPTATGCTGLRTLRGVDLHLLTLVSLEDDPIADAAAVIGLTTAAAKTRLHRIRAALRDQLSEERAGLTPRAEP